MKKGMKNTPETIAKMKKAQQLRAQEGYIVCTAYELQLMGYKWALDSLYVTKDGKVINTKFFDCEFHYKPLTPSLNGDYYQVSCQSRKGGIGVHELIALAWIGPRPQGMVVDHIDRNKKNNTLENLHYVTRSENALNQDHPEHHTYKGRYSTSTEMYTRPNGERIRMTPLNYYCYMMTVDKNKAHKFLKKNKALIEACL